MLSATAKAKLNLYLHITGKRADGYHLLDSLVCFVALGDSITVEDAPELSLTVEGPFAAAISADADNLVMRAANVLRAHAGVDVGAHITLCKNLPVAAGLGGGSSDAATCLILLRSLWGLAISDSMLATLAVPLGADMSVCLHGKPAYMSGIGEVIEPAPTMPALYLLLVNPMRELSTAEVYRRFQAEARTTARPEIDASSADRLVISLATTRNDLQRPAITLCAEVAEVLLALETQFDCRLARMCGSGATCMGVFEDEQACLRAAETIRRDHPQWWIAPTQLA